MPCYHALVGIDLGLRPNGKRYIKIIPGRELTEWQRAQARIVPLPCGKCLDCRESRAKTWAVRLVHEASLYSNNCFVTLTYNDANYPKGGSLDKKHLQQFMKDLRKRYGSGIRFYGIGEYGDRFDRPHFHVMLFNFNFPDLVLMKVKNGVPLYRSSSLESIWKRGFCSVGEVTFDSAAYVARYCLKKYDGDMAPDHYQGRQPEFSRMSLRPGIAREWFEKHRFDDVDLFYRQGFVICNGRTYKIPRFYDVKFEAYDPAIFEDIKADRVAKAKESLDNTVDRLRIREKVHRAKNAMRKRNLDD